MTVTVDISQLAIQFPAAFHILIAVVILAGASFWARRRWLRQRPATSLWARIAVPAVLVTVGIAALSLVEDAPNSGPRPMIDYLFPLLLGAVALVPISLIEIATRPLRPVRSSGWIVVSCLLFMAGFYSAVAFGVASIGSSLSLGERFVALGSLHVILVALCSGAGLLWWSYLPLAGVSLPEVFE